MKIVYENENGERIPTDCRIENDMLIVSTNSKKFKPKDGDVVVSGSFVFIYNDRSTAGTYYYCGMILNSHKTLFPDGGRHGHVTQLRPATEEEKKLLFDKIDQEGFTWDAEKKVLIKKEWKPKRCECYCYPVFLYDKVEFKPETFVNLNTPIDITLCDKGWVFRTEKECDMFCDKLNKAINPIKP